MWDAKALEALEQFRVQQLTLLTLLSAAFPLYVLSSLLLILTVRSGMAESMSSDPDLTLVYFSFFLTHKWELESLLCVDSSTDFTR